jgi:hypothetical protein
MTCINYFNLSLSMSVLLFGPCMSVFRGVREITYLVPTPLPPPTPISLDLWLCCAFLRYDEVPFWEFRNGTTDGSRPFEKVPFSRPYKHTPKKFNPPPTPPHPKFQPSPIYIRPRQTHYLGKQVPNLLLRFSNSL